MRIGKNILREICPAEKFRRLLAGVGLLMLVNAASALAQVKPVVDWVPVSINSGETYVIDNIKPGTQPSVHVADNPSAFVSYNSPPGKFTMLGGRSWAMDRDRHEPLESGRQLRRQFVCRGAPRRAAETGHGAAVNQRRRAQAACGSG